MTADPRASEHRGWSLLLGYGAIAAAVPYLALKLLWLSGDLRGVPAGSPAAAEEFVYANAMTMGMDAVAVLLALTLTHRWGTRVPAWLLVVPVWVGTGLLVPAALQVAAGGLVTVVTGGRALSLEGGLVEPWVYVMVGTSFAMQGVFLSAAFALYAHRRWSGMLRSDPVDRRGAAHGVLVILARAAGSAAVAITVVYGYWLFADAGPFGAYEDGWAASQRSNLVLSGLLAMAGAVGIAGMLRPARRLPFSGATVLTWVGSGSLFSWGLYQVVPVLVGSSLAQNLSGLGNLVHLVSVLAGLVLGLVGMLRIVERVPADRAS